MLKNPTGKDQVVGAMMQVDLKQNPAEELVLIPVNGANIPQDIESQLNKIYEGTGGKFKIRIAPNYQSPITSLVCGESGFMANYTEEQNAFVKTYQSQSQNQAFDDTKRYVFIMKDITPSRPLSGFMPLGRQVGFVFTGGDKGENANETKQGNIAITLAHELGHGVYQIQHPWEQLNTQKTEISTNSWLMSYGQGIQLPYIHWEQISHPKFIIPIFKSDESGEMATGKAKVKNGDETVASDESKDVIFGGVLEASAYKLIYDETLSFGEFEKDFQTQYAKITESEIEKKADDSGKRNIKILESLSESFIKGVFENTPIVGIRNVISSPTDEILINHFYSKKGTDLIFDKNSKLSKDLIGNPTFEEYYKKYIDKIIDRIRTKETDKIDKTYLLSRNKGIGLLNFSKIPEIPSYDFYGLMGGTQRIEVRLQIFEAKGLNYKIVSDFKIEDWFGADWDDINLTSSYKKAFIPSLKAFFWLQHHYQYKPFITRIEHHRETGIELKK